MRFNSVCFSKGRIRLPVLSFIRQLAKIIPHLSYKKQVLISGFKAFNSIFFYWKHSSGVFPTFRTHTEFELISITTSIALQACQFLVQNVISVQFELAFFSQKANKYRSAWKRLSSLNTKSTIVVYICSCYTFKLSKGSVHILNRFLGRYLLCKAN